MSAQKRSAKLRLIKKKNWNFIVGNYTQTYEPQRVRIPDNVMLTSESREPPI